MSQTPIQPLSVGNVVSSALVLYRSNLKSYLGVAFRVTLWTLIPFLTQLLIGQIQGQISSSVLRLISIALLALVFYSQAKADTNLAVIARLAFGELINQPETVKSVSDNLNSRKWKFFWTAFSVSLRLMLAFIGLCLVFIFSVFLLTGLVTIIPQIFANSPIIAIIAYLIIALLYIVLFVGVFTGIFWFIARFFIAELPLAVEPNVGIDRAVERSWELTKGSAFRIVLILSVAYLIATPINTIASIPIGFIFPSFQQIYSSPLEYERSLSNAFILAIILIMIANTFLIPFWQSIKAVIYYDLRSRKEGLDLQLRDRPLEM